MVKAKHEVEELHLVNQEALNARDIAKVPAHLPLGVLSAAKFLRHQNLNSGVHEPFSPVSLRPGPAV